MTDNFWIAIELHSDETVDALHGALAACLEVHKHALAALNDYFMQHAEPLRYALYRPQLMTYLQTTELIQHAQRYSLINAAEKTFPYFSERKSFDKKNKFVAVKPIPLKEYIDLKIQTRRIWRKYLALNNLITTRYGTIYLDPSWTETVTVQSAEQGVDFHTVPFLAHSITLHLDEKQPLLRFNLHDHKTKFGKRAVRKEKAKISHE